MSTKRPKLQLRRSISEQLRDSTSKAWDLLWRNVRERRLAGQWLSAPSGTVRSLLLTNNPADCVCVIFNMVTDFLGKVIAKFLWLWEVMPAGDSYIQLAGR